jgi:hypothetical protein
MEQSTWGDPNNIGIVFSGTQRDEPFGVYRGPAASLLSRRRAEPPRAALQPSVKAERGARPAPPVTTGRTPPNYSHAPAVVRPPSRGVPFTRLLASLSRGSLRLLLLLTALCLLASVLWLHVRVRSVETSLVGRGGADANPAAPAAPKETPASVEAAAPKANPDPETMTSPNAQTALTDAPAVQPGAKSIPTGNRARQSAGRAVVGREGGSARANRNGSGASDRNRRATAASRNSRPSGTTNRPRTANPPRPAPPAANSPPRTTPPPPAP